jgi:hypothetical protein
MDLYTEWTRVPPSSDFRDTYISGDQVGNVANSSRATGSRKAPSRSGRGGQSAGQSGASGGGGGTGLVDGEVDIYPDDSITLIFEAAAEQDDGDEPPDDEHTDDESDESFFARLNTWVTSVQPGPPPPPSPAPLPAYSHPGSKRKLEQDIDSDGSATFVGVTNHPTCICMRGSIGQGEKIGVLPSDSIITPSFVQ